MRKELLKIARLNCAILSHWKRDCCFYLHVNPYFTGHISDKLFVSRYWTNRNRPMDKT
jgi:hypothetical protein